MVMHYVRDVFVLAPAGVLSVLLLHSAALFLAYKRFCFLLKLYVANVSAHTYN